MRIITRALTAAALLVATSCSSAVRTGNSPSFLVIQNLQAIAGGPTPGMPSTILFSDVSAVLTTGNNSSGAPCTPAAPCVGVVYNDDGQVVLQLAPKNVTSTTQPTTNNQVTINRIHIHYVPATSGGAVPSDIDTAATATVPPTGTVTIGFELVTAGAKRLPPLSGLVGGGQLSVIAEVTFFGTDQVGNAISVTGSVQIEFANWVG